MIVSPSREHGSSCRFRNLFKGLRSLRKCQVTRSPPSAFKGRLSRRFPDTTAPLVAFLKVDCLEDFRTPRRPLWPKDGVGPLNSLGIQRLDAKSLKELQPSEAAEID
jgi:hypothetical protein